MARILSLVVILCMSSVSWGTKVENSTTTSKISANERIRRLIPYMTFYLAHPVSQSLASQYGQQSQPQDNEQGWPYPPVQPPQQQQQYIVGPQHYQPPFDTRYIEQSTPLTKMITQDYLAIAKQQGKLHPRLNLHPHQGIQGYTLANLGAPEQESLHQEIDKEPQHYKPQIDIGQYHRQPQYRPIQIQTPQPPQNDYKYQDVSYQYRPEVVLQYQTPASVQDEQYNQYKQQQQPQTLYKPRQKLVPIKQHLTEITRPVNRPNLYSPQKTEVRPYSMKPKPFTYQTAATTVDITEPTVSIMQSQEIEVGTESARFSTPIATVEPKYKPIFLPSSPKYHAVYIAKSTTPAPEAITFTEHYEYEDEGMNVNNILEGVSKTIPDKITTENLDSSIRALSKILKILQRANTLTDSAKEVARLPKPIESNYPTKALASPQLEQSFGRGDMERASWLLFRKIPTKKPKGDDEDGGTPGQAGVDYPVHDTIPQTSFSCRTQRYKGFFGDPETGCQVWHYCDLNGGQASFLCPNGTIFSQVALTCDWWFNVKCASTAQLYVLNERLYKYILPQKPSFPEDFAGPIVDQYLTNKFREIELGNKNKTTDGKNMKELDPSINNDDHQYSLDDVESENKVRSISILS